VAVRRQRVKEVAIYAGKSGIQVTISFLPNISQQDSIFGDQLRKNYDSAGKSQ
jgi:hypothetical protein